ncbi:hypothetical protein WJX72_002902 [[Myrmecia] bisecta]|uniref:Uncharacterized protein n=1 Tax=[Myrmecia] bisecta TaxID=41462 RepID=A0AAW1PPG7_9CHLO
MDYIDAGQRNVSAAARELLAVRGHPQRGAGAPLSPQKAASSRGLQPGSQLYKFQSLSDPGRLGLARPHRSGELSDSSSQLDREPFNKRRTDPDYRPYAALKMHDQAGASASGDLDNDGSPKAAKRSRPSRSQAIAVPSSGREETSAAGAAGTVRSSSAQAAASGSGRQHRKEAGRPRKPRKGSFGSCEALWPDVQGELDAALAKPNDPEALELRWRTLLDKQYVPPVGQLFHLMPPSMRRGKGGRQASIDPRLDPDLDDKRARRILSNRLSAARSKLKQRQAQQAQQHKEAAAKGAAQEGTAVTASRLAPSSVEEELANAAAWAPVSGTVCADPTGSPTGKRASPTHFQQAAPTPADL